MTPEQKAEINRQALEVYQQLAEEREREAVDIHRAGLCSAICALMLPRVTRLGLPAEIVQVTSVFEDRFHSYLETISHPTQIIDAGWQFFLEKENSKLPTVLICPRNRLVETLTEYGITGFTQFYWLARPDDSSTDLGFSYRELKMWFDHKN